MEEKYMTQIDAEWWDYHVGTQQVDGEEFWLLLNKIGAT